MNLFVYRNLQTILHRFLTGLASKLHSFLVKGKTARRHPCRFLKVDHQLESLVPRVSPEKVDTEGLDVKKLKGYNKLFRVRIGKYRIICEQIQEFGFVIVKVTNRNDTTYNF